MEVTNRELLAADLLKILAQDYSWESSAALTAEAESDLVILATAALAAATVIYPVTDDEKGSDE